MVRNLSQLVHPMRRLMFLFCVVLDYPPDHVEDIYDQLEESQDSNSLIKGLSPQESGWLASVIRSKSTAARERVAESIRKDLNVSLSIGSRPRRSRFQRRRAILKFLFFRTFVHRETSETSVSSASGTIVYRNTSRCERVSSRSGTSYHWGRMRWPKGSGSS